MKKKSRIEAMAGILEEKIGDPLYKSVAPFIGESLAALLWVLENDLEWDEAAKRVDKLVKAKVKVVTE